VLLCRVKPPELVAHLVPRNFLHAINPYADSTNARRVELEELITTYPSMRNVEPAEGIASVTTSVHSECTIAVHMIQEFLGHHLQIVDIGISKYSCWFCQRYLELLMSVAKTRFVVAGYQGKLQAGWMPPNGPAD
jgi:hypothetical protein